MKELLTDRYVLMSKVRMALYAWQFPDFSTSPKLLQLLKNFLAPDTSKQVLDTIFFRLFPD